jgi:hypothetical protein
MKKQDLWPLSDQELKIIWVSLNSLGNLTREDAAFVQNVASNKDAGKDPDDQAYELWDMVDNELSRRGEIYMSVAKESFLENAPELHVYVRSLVP